MGAALKLLLIQRCGSDIPYLDQWTAEGSSVLRPWLNGEFGWRHFFWPHGEHHPAVARVGSLLCFILNGQWDDRVQQVANVASFAAFLGMIGLWVSRIFSDWRLPVAVLAAAALLGSPGIHENHLWGFQSAFFGVLTFGLLQLLGMAEPGSWWKWLLGLCGGVVALFTIASGVTSSVILGGVAAIGLACAGNRRWAGATLAASVGLLAWGWWLMSDAVAHTGGMARGAGELAARFGVLLAWPAGSRAAVLLQAPLLASICFALLRRGKDRLHFLISVFGLWCWALIACLAIGRDSGFQAVAVRYWDILATGLVANVVALLAFWPERRGARSVWALCAAAWIAVVGSAYWQFSNPRHLEWLAGHYAEVAREQHTMVDTYLRTGRFGGRGDGATHPFLPHPTFTRVLLDDPVFRRVLPPSVVPPCVVLPDEQESAGFTRVVAPDGRATLTTTGPATTERVLVSREIEACGRAFLRLTVRGVVGVGGAELFLADMDGRRHEMLDARVDSPGRFKTEHIPGGAKRFRVVARVPAGQELAFTEPIEIGPLSYAVPKLLRLWPVLFWAGAACFVGGLVTRLRRRTG